MLATIFLVNGYQIEGVIRSFDNFTILLDVDGKQQLVYKHAVSTIIPIRNISLQSAEEEGVVLKIRGRATDLPAI